MRAYRVGIAGPVGSGKTALVDQLSKQLWPQVNLAVVTNDIYTREDAEFLLVQERHQLRAVLGRDVVARRERGGVGLLRSGCRGHVSSPLGTRMTLGAEGAMADADHLIGALALTVAVIAAAESARPLRYLNALLGLALVITAFVLGGTALQTLAGVACGLALVGLSLPRGAIRNEYGGWSRLLV
jgi:hypothetical protein